MTPTPPSAAKCEDCQLAHAFGFTTEHATALHALLARKEAEIETLKDRNPICTSLWLRLYGDYDCDGLTSIWVDENGVAVVKFLKGWCPACGSVMLADGTKISPGKFKPHMALRASEESRP